MQVLPATDCLLHLARRNHKRLIDRREGLSLLSDILDAPCSGPW